MERIDAGSALPAGTQLGGCTLLSLAARGRFSLNYEARAQDGSPVAVKELFPDEFVTRSGLEVRPRDPDDRAALRWWMRSFLDKANSLSGLRHPHLVTVLQAFEANGTACFTYLPVRGESLAKRIETLAPVPEAQLCRWLVQILSALELAHSAGVLHRDVHAQNIILTAEGDAVLIEFGVLRAPIRLKGRVVSQEAGHGFVAPEMRDSAGEPGPWTDLYSLARVVRQAMGERPVSSAQSTLASAATIRPGEYSANFVHWVDLATEADPSARPRTAAAWIQGLGEVPIAGRNLETPRHAQPAQKQVPGKTRPARKLWAVPALLLLVGLGVFFAVKPGSQDRLAVPAVAGDPGPAEASTAAEAGSGLGEEIIIVPLRTSSDGGLERIARDVMRSEQEAREEQLREAEIAMREEEARLEQQRQLQREAAARAERPAAPAPNPAERLEQQTRIEEAERLAAEARERVERLQAEQLQARLEAERLAQQQVVNLILERVRERVSYPERAERLGQEGTVVVDVAVGRDGAVVSTAVSTSSGFSVLDQAAERAFNGLKQLPPLPENLSPGQTSISFAVPITFRVNES